MSSGRSLPGLLACVLLAFGCVANAQRPSRATAHAPARAGHRDPARSSDRLRVARLFADDMVLQRGTRVPVWGWAAPHERVVVTFDRHRHPTRADGHGRWRVLLPVLRAGGPHTMTVAAGGERLRIRDILVGDVWVASGQSNMELAVSLANDAAREIAAAHDGAIREFKIPKSAAGAPSDSLAGGQWEPADSAHVGRFSAVAYYFARALRPRLAVPIGIINATWGATRIESWMSRDALQRETGADIYNKMIHPLFPFPIEGVIWYQGESNAENYVDALHYKALFRDLIASWRRGWGDDDLPFLWVQLPGFMAPSDTPQVRSNWALLRESQSGALELPRTGQAVTIDVGDADNIHPKDKQDVGARLALLARQVAYGERGLDADGPTFAGMRLDGGRAHLAFAHARGGLVAGSGSASLGGFAIAGADRHFVWANASIEGDSVVVWSDAVPQPVAVRYAWADDPARANLRDGRGLPAAPFRTDDW